jgi:hypothetical protein
MVGVVVCGGLASWAEVGVVGVGGVGVGVEGEGLRHGWLLVEAGSVLNQRSGICESCVTDAIEIFGTCIFA